MAGFEMLKRDVIGVGLCHDCGTCVGVCPSKAIVMNYDQEEPAAVKECLPRCNLCYEVCPGKDIPIPDLERMLFGRERTPEEEWIGIGQTYIEGHAMDPLIRIGGASGGLVSGLLLYALENDVIDAALVAGNREDKPWRVIPKIVTNRQEVMETSQSKLSYVCNNSLLGEAMGRGFKRLGIVGLPCHVHGIRKIQLTGKLKKIAESIKFVIGLCCGNGTNYRGAEHIIEEIAGVPLGEVAKVRIRNGHYPGLYTIFTKAGLRVVLPDSGRRFHSWAFRTYRSALCTDYAAELADLTVGDYFSPHMVEGVPGLTIGIVRTDIGKKLLEDAEAANYIHTEQIKKDPFLWGGFETKKHGGLYHLMERKRHGWPTPDLHRPVDYPKPEPRKLGLRRGEIHPHY